MGSLAILPPEPEKCFICFRPHCICGEAVCVPWFWLRDAFFVFPPALMGRCRETIDFSFHIGSMKPEGHPGLKTAWMSLGFLEPVFTTVGQRLGGSFIAVLCKIFSKYAQYSCENLPRPAAKSLAKPPSPAVNTDSYFLQQMDLAQQRDFLLHALDGVYDADEPT